MTRRTPKMDPPEPMPDSIECPECGYDQSYEHAPVETIEHADGAVTENVLCENCGHVLESRLASEPDGVMV